MSGAPAKGVVCRSCGAEKPVDAFGIKASAPTGRSRQCKACRNEYTRKRWYPQNREKQIDASRAWKKANPIRVLATRHGLAQDAVAAVMSQPAVCGICSTGHDLVLDHCHDSATPRGRLCRGCNSLVGRLGDSPEAVRERVARILAYLNRGAS